MDFMLGIPPSKHNGIVYDAILVFIDSYSKIALYVLVKKTITALQISGILHEKVILKFRYPEGIVSDRDSGFQVGHAKRKLYNLKRHARLNGKRNRTTLRNSRNTSIFFILPSLPRSVKLPIRVVKRPPNKPNRKSATSLKLLSLRLELIHIPVSPQELAVQEARFGTCKPNVKSCRQGNYVFIKSAVVRDFALLQSIGWFPNLPLSSMPVAAIPPASLFIAVSTMPGWMWKMLISGLLKLT
jgi:hypothetical protein